MKECSTVVDSNWPFEAQNKYQVHFNGFGVSNNKGSDNKRRERSFFWRVVIGQS